MTGTILILSGDPAATSVIQRELSGEGSLLVFDRFSAAYDCICNEMPLLLIADMAAETEARELIALLKDDPLFSGLPVIGLFDDARGAPEWNVLQVDDYIWKKDITRELRTRVQLCLLRARRVVEMNPLTRLPGNISINRQIQNRLDEKQSFALAYADLDNFKPYNDTYGFSRGDDVLRITGRLLFNITKGRQKEGSFVGHIGGDDFVSIAGTDVMEDICRDVIRAFDRIIPTFYDPEDRDRGFIQGHDRSGKARHFPLLAISIGVVFSESPFFSHYGEITEIAAELKAFAKEHEGSCYRLNRRHYSSNEE
jgi:GGDEF domain-containing protein